MIVVEAVMETLLVVVAAIMVVVMLLEGGVCGLYIRLSCAGVAYGFKAAEYCKPLLRGMSAAYTDILIGR